MGSITEVFGKEALHFTPWLSKNLDKLTHLINANLTQISTVKDIDGKKCDIMAQNLHKLNF